MKRLLPFIPVLLFLLVNSCAPAVAPLDINVMATSIANTLIATISTPTPSPAFNPTISAMVSWLNMDLSITNSLRATIDADYHVNNITFPNIRNSQKLIIRVDVGCTCMKSTGCCTPEGTFVVIIESLKKSFPLDQFPSEADQMLVVCYDRTELQIGAISASWQDVLRYIGGTLDGHQLGVQVTRTIAP